MLDELFSLASALEFCAALEASTTALLLAAELELFATLLASAELDATAGTLAALELTTAGTLELARTGALDARLLAGVLLAGALLVGTGLGDKSGALLAARLDAGVRLDAALLEDTGPLINSNVV